MCDEETERDNRAYLKQQNLSRRSFNAVGAAAGMAMLLPRAANAHELTKSYVKVPTPDGEADCFFVHPAKGSHAGVIIWPDILGLRPAFEMMGARLAEAGYAVLVVNPYYRQVAAPVVEPGDSFSDQPVRDKILPFARSLTSQTNVADAKAFVEFLDKQPSVDKARKIGTTGYCMGGPMVMRTAAAVPERIGAGGSFHGGGLVTRDEDSPHMLIPEMNASFLIAVAENDHEKNPIVKDVLSKSFDEAELSAEIEVYEGAMHGWCPPDSSVYNFAQAERAWSRLLVLFETALA